MRIYKNYFQYFNLRNSNAPDCCCPTTTRTVCVCVCVCTRNFTKTVGGIQYIHLRYKSTHKESLFTRINASVLLLLFFFFVVCLCDKILCLPYKQRVLRRTGKNIFRTLRRHV